MTKPTRKTTKKRHPGITEFSDNLGPGEQIHDKHGLLFSHFEKEFTERFTRPGLPKKAKPSQGKPSQAIETGDS